MKASRLSRSIAAAVLATVTLSSVLSLAHAAPVADPQSRVVRYDDLNLGTSAGVEALYRRIKEAARDVCGEPTVTGSHLVTETWKDCVAGAVRHAVLTVNQPTLTTYYAARLRDPRQWNPG
jgi:UrcA family protein